MYLGFDEVHVKTPKAEIKLRSGEIPAIALQIECLFNDKYRLVVFYNKGYPSVEPTLYLLDSSLGDKSCTFNPKRNAFDPPTTYQVDLTQDIMEKMKDIHASTDVDRRYMLDVIKDVREKLCTDANLNISGKSNNDGDYDGGDNIEDIKIEDLQVGESDNTKDEGLEMNREKHQSVFMYKCKMCRCPLFSSEMIDEHDNKEQGEIDRKSVFNVCDSFGNKRCQNIFLSQTPEWLQLDGFAGKIICPNKKCSSKLGNWSWGGSACSCGIWQCPSFQITSGRVDFTTDIGNVKVTSTATATTTTA